MEERAAIVKYILKRVNTENCYMPLDWSVKDELEMLAEEIQEGMHLELGE